MLYSMCSVCRPNWLLHSHKTTFVVGSSLTPVFMCSQIDFFRDPILGPTCCGEDNFVASVSAKACNNSA